MFVEEATRAPMTERRKTMESTNSVMRIGIVGAGHAGARLFDMFNRSELTDVAYVADVNPDAPGMVAASEAGVETHTDLEEALARKGIDLVLEITGKDTVVSLVKDRLDPDCRLIDHTVAYVLLSVLEEKRLAVDGQVVKDISTIRDEIMGSLTNIGKLLEKIDKISDDLQLLALNARIEAARAGDHGRGFSIVAQEVEKSAEFAKKTAKEIERVNTNILSVSQRLDTSVEQLQ